MPPGVQFRCLITKKFHFLMVHLLLFKNISSKIIAFTECTMVRPPPLVSIMVESGGAGSAGTLWSEGTSRRRHFAQADRRRSVWTSPWQPARCDAGWMRRAARRLTPTSVLRHIWNQEETFEQKLKSRKRFMKRNAFFHVFPVGPELNIVNLNHDCNKHQKVVSVWFLQKNFREREKLCRRHSGVPHGDFWKWNIYENWMSQNIPTHSTTPSPLPHRYSWWTYKL